MIEALPKLQTPKAKEHAPRRGPDDRKRLGGADRNRQHRTTEKRRQQRAGLKAANDNTPGRREVVFNADSGLPLTLAEIEVFTLLMNAIQEPANDNEPPPIGIAA